MKRPWKSLIALRWSTESLVKRGAFVYVFTYWTIQDLVLMSKHWGIVQTRLRKSTGMNGVRVYELGDLFGRFHVHVVVDRPLGWDDIKEATDGTLLGYCWDCGPAGPGIALYLVLDLTKGFVRDDDEEACLRRRWATFGDWPGRERAKDIEIHSDFIDMMSFVARNCKRGTTRTEIIEEAYRLYFQDMMAEQLARERDEASAATTEQGDAFEDQSGDAEDTDFDVGELEK